MSLFSQARTTFQRSPAELADNERRSLVGDTVIKLCLTVMMDSSLQPGAITSIKGALESNVVHARLAVLYGLHLELQAHGAQAAIIRFNPSQQADVFEAFVGAVYESHGHAATEGLSRGNGIFAKRPRPHLDEAGRAEQKCRLMRCLR